MMKLATDLLLNNLPKPFDLTLINVGVSNLHSAAVPAGCRSIATLFAPASNITPASGAASLPDPAGDDVTGVPAQNSALSAALAGAATPTSDTHGTNACASISAALISRAIMVLCTVDAGWPVQMCALLVQGTKWQAPLRSATGLWWCRTSGGEQADRARPHGCKGWPASERGFARRQPPSRRDQVRSNDAVSSHQ